MSRRGRPSRRFGPATTCPATLTWWARCTHGRYQPYGVRAGRRAASQCRWMSESRIRSPGAASATAAISRKAVDLPAPGTPATTIRFACPGRLCVVMTTASTGHPRPPSVVAVGLL